MRSCSARTPRGDEPDLARPAVRGLLPLATFDVNAFEVTDHEQAIVRLAEDVARVASVVRDELPGGLTRTAALQTAHDASADPDARRDLITECQNE